MRRLRILTWHVHGNYLWYLAQTGHEFFLPVKHDGSAGYGGRGTTFPFGENVRDVPASEVADLTFDAILYQHSQHYLHDRDTLLSSAQRELPQIFVQHDPPLDHPTEQRHWFQEEAGLLVHVTHFNELMWDSGCTPTRVIEHGVPEYTNLTATGEIPRGIVAINNLGSRGRRLGLDIFLGAREQIPLDLVGMEARRWGGLGEVKPPLLPAFAARYRFFFNPIRYTSLGLAVCEAMMLGLPIVGLATTEMATLVTGAEVGYVDTNWRRLLPAMRRLIDDPHHARRLGDNARAYARERFGMVRFIRDWNEALCEALDRKHHVASPNREGARHVVTHSAH